MKLSQVVKKIEERLPVELVADHDNVGLIAGDRDDEINSISVAYELNAGVVEEAAGSDANLIITYHTPLFRPARSFTTSRNRPDPLFQAARSGLNVIAVHTALDVDRTGLNFDLASRLGLKNIRFLSPLGDTLRKLVVFVPVDHLDLVRGAMSRAGAGVIGNYSECAFSTEGEGAFLPCEGSSPHTGKVGKPERAAESRLEMVVERSHVAGVVQAMMNAHPYEEVAYDLYPLLNESPNYGFGAVGELEKPVTAAVFLEKVKKVLGLDFIKISHVREMEVGKIALCAGSGMAFYKDAARCGADIYITGDVKHHDFREAGTGRTMLADATHRGTELFAAEILYGILKKTFENRIVVNLSKHEYDGAVIV